MFRDHLEHLNQVVRNELDEFMGYAIDNGLAGNCPATTHTHTHSHRSLNLNRISIGVRYERVQHDGPKVRVITIQHPLFTPYFTDGGLKGKPLADVETEIFGAAGRHMMAHNGWVMSADPLRDFARPNEGRGNVYLKRELIAWGDSVKLR